MISPGAMPTALRGHEFCVGMACGPRRQGVIPGTPFKGQIIPNRVAAPIPTQSRGHGTRRRHWWTEKGAINAIDEPAYLENAVEYVTNLQGD